MKKLKGSNHRLVAMVVGVLVLAAAFFVIYTRYVPIIPDAPTGASAERGNAQAIVSFNMPEGTTTSYTVTSNPEGITATGTSSPITVTGLTNGTAYTFTVVATNQAGCSPASAASASVTPMTTPGIPRELAAVAGDEIIELTWAEPADNGGGNITGYEVSTDGGNSYVPASSSTGHTVTGLANDMAYDLRVRAVNEVGAGTYAAVSATPSDIVIPTTVSEVFTDSTGLEWRVLAVTDGSALIITEHVHLTNTRYHYEDDFRPFQTAEISTTLNTWFGNDAFVSPGLRARALPYAFQLDDGTPGGNGVEHQATTWVYTPSDTNQQQARTIPGAPGSGDKAFLLSVSEVNEYFSRIEERVALRISEEGVVGRPAYWWLRSPSRNATYQVWVVGMNGFIFFDPANYATSHLGVRPALWVTL